MGAFSWLHLPIDILKNERIVDHVVGNYATQGETE